MANLPNLNAEIFFGDPEKPLPDWRKEMSESEDMDEDHELSTEERQSLIGMLGFDPAELDTSESAAEPDDEEPSDQ